MFLPLRISATLFLSLILLSVTSLKEIKGDQPLTITINEGSVRALSLAMVPKDDDKLIKIFDIVAKDLKLTGRIDIFNQEDISSQPTGFKEVNFKNWRIFGVENILIGSIERTNSEYVLTIELIDVFRQIIVKKEKFLIHKGGERKIAHLISDMIYLELIGRLGSFNSKLAYVAVSDLGSGRSYSLIISDYDGYNQKIILNSDFPLFSLAWSPKAKKIAYVSFESGQSAIYIQSLKTGVRKEIRYGDGIVGAPAFAPDSSSIIFTASNSGNIDLYRYIMETGSVARFTNLDSIETEASISPSGKKILFTSNKSGGTQIFRMENKPFSVPERVTFGLSKFNANPVHSLDGKKFAYVTKILNSYQIVVSDLEQNQIRLMSRGKFDESPSFSPNGDMIVFSAKNGLRSELILKSVEGLDVEHRVSFPDSSLIEPSWSPNFE